MIFHRIVLTLGRTRAFLFVLILALIIVLALLSESKMADKDKSDKRKDKNVTKNTDSGHKGASKKGKDLQKGGEVTQEESVTLNDLFKLGLENKKGQEDLQKSVNEQSQSLANMTERVEVLETYGGGANYDFENVDAYLTEQGLEGDNPTGQEETAPQAQIQDGSGEPASKKTKDSDNAGQNAETAEVPCSGKFKMALEKFQKKERTGPNIDGDLASAINEVFVHGLSKETFESKTKDTNYRPENCQGLRQVRVNPIIFERLPPYQRSAEDRMQDIQRAVVKAASIFARIMNSSESPEEVVKMLTEKGLDALMLLGHANANFQWRRREILRKHVERKYFHLCGAVVDFTDQLFGDDLNKTVSEINQMSRVAGVMGRGGYPNYGGRGGFRGRGGFGGRGRGGNPNGHRGRGGRGRGAPAYKNQSYNRK